MPNFDSLLRRVFVLAAATLVHPGCSSPEGSGGQGGASSASSTTGAGGAASASGDAAAVSVGINTACVVTREGDVACWGITRQGDVESSGGFQHDMFSDVPVPVPGLPSKIRAVSAAQAHNCALTTAGGVLCWGLNDHGELGDGTTAVRHLPVAVSGLSSGVVAISAGDQHTCALTGAGAVSCWGDNAEGQLGDGTLTESHVPVAVNGLPSGIGAVSVMSATSCALTRAGAVWCWGRSDSHQLGDGVAHPKCGAFACSPVPVAASGLDAGVTAISVAGNRACALSSSKGVLCWGGAPNPSALPVAVPGLASGVAAISAGQSSSCALTRAGAATCWGLNDEGQLGADTHVPRSNPVPVKGLGAGVAAVVAGETSCALTTSGGLLCWGFGGWGTLGDGKTVHENCDDEDCAFAPVEVVGF